MGEVAAPPEETAVDVGMVDEDVEEAVIAEVEVAAIAEAEAAAVVEKEESPERVIGAAPVAGTTISPGDKHAIDAKKRGQMALAALAAAAVTAADVAADSAEAVAAIEVAEGAVVAVTAAVAVAVDPCAAVAAVVEAGEDRPLTDFYIRPLKKA